MIPKPGDPDRPVPVEETFHEQTDEELTEQEVKQMEADDQAIQTILIGLPEDIYATVDSCETDQEIWLHVQQMMKGSNIGIQEKNAMLFNEWERFTSTDGESIESYYHQRLARAHAPLALMANSNNPYNYPVFHQDQPSPVTHMYQPLPNNSFIPQPSFNTNYMQQPMPNPKNITDPTTEMNMIAHPGMNLGQDKQNAVQNPGVQNVGNQNGLIVVPRIANPNANRIGNGDVVAARAEGNTNGNNGNQIRCYNCIGLDHFARNCTAKPRKRDVAFLQTQLLIAQKEEAWNQLQAEEFDFMAVAGDLEEIEEVNAKCILLVNLQQVSTLVTQTDKAHVYDSDGSVEVHEYDQCYNNKIFNMFTQEEHYTNLLEPIPDPHQVQQNDSNVTVQFLMWNKVGEQ
ncbi:hypothetical protein Tco_0417210 [Tanacetum coccineum]